MISELSAARVSSEMAARCFGAALRGENTDEADVGLVWFCEVLNYLRESVTKK